MDLFTVLTLMGVIAFIGVTIYLANAEQAQHKSPIGSRFLLYTLIAMMFLLAPSAYFMTLEPDYTGAPTQLWVALGLVVVGVGISYVNVASVLFRQGIQRLLSASGSFNADSMVHTSAIVLMIALFLWNTIPFVMQGGIEGYARSLQENGGVSSGEPIINAVLQVAAAFLGIGLYIRRGLPQSLERLGLRIPTQRDILAGIGGGVGLLIVSIIFGVIWIIVAPDVAQQQSAASDQIAQSFASLPLAFLLAVCAALGEEIFMRGALQPVFGVFATSLFFTSLHAQYLITPPLLLIFVVAMVLGLLRKYVSTNASIVAHFVFDFAQISVGAFSIWNIQMKTRYTGLLMLVFFVFAMPLSAQNPSVQTPTPGGLVYGMDAEVLFPEAVRFTIALTSTANDLLLTSLTLHITGQSPVTIPINISQSATLRDPFTELAYVWNIPRDNPPPLFSTISYEWQITKTNNQVTAALNGFEFTDPRLGWTEDTAQNSNITFTVPDENFNVPVLSLRTNMQAAYDFMQTNTGQQPNFHVMVYPVNLAPGCSTNAAGESLAIGMLSGTEIPCNSAQADAVYRASSVDVFQLAGIDTETQLRLALADLFTERFYGGLWSASDVPLWFQRGLAVFYLPTNKLNLLEPAQRAARGDNLFSLEDMNSEPTQNADLWRVQSYGMVLYLARHVGVQNLFTLARNPGTSFNAAYQAAMGQPLSNLINSWQRWLFTSAAEDAYGYYPQLATTETPTATPTATEPRPTATSTATDTPTLTPTATDTGIPQQILPTLTATPRPTEAPPSVTPRPAGSLRTPTPTPTTAPATGRQGTIFAALAIVFLALALIAAAVLRLGRRS